MLGGLGRPRQWVHVSGAAAPWEAAAYKKPASIASCKKVPKASSFYEPAPAPRAAAVSPGLSTELSRRSFTGGEPRPRAAREGAAGGRGRCLGGAERGCFWHSAPLGLLRSTQHWWSDGRLTPMSPSYFPDHRASAPDAGGGQAGWRNLWEALLTHPSPCSSPPGSGQGGSPLGSGNPTQRGSSLRNTLMGRSLPRKQLCLGLNVCGYTFKPHVLVDLCNLLARASRHSSIPG